jgi:hypothetical protein
MNFRIELASDLNSSVSAETIHNYRLNIGIALVSDRLEALLDEPFRIERWNYD